MTSVNFDQLLEAGAHFGHLKRKWNPNMAPYIFMEKNGIHIIDLHKTVKKIDEAGMAIKQFAKSGKKILFVSTKKQAKEILSEYVKEVNMPYVTERWAGGMLTNFNTIRKAVKKMSSIDSLMSSPQWDSISKRERLQIQRERAKLEKNLGSISDLSRLPAAVFVVDIMKEHIAVAEAKKLNIPIFAIVDTNSDPTLVDFPIPANDDASKSIAVIIKSMCDAIQEGLNEKALNNDKMEEEEIVEEEVFKAVEEEKVERTGRRRRLGESTATESMEDKKKRPASRRPISKK
ncbi:MAG: 30S ribosomal protein S2 [Bacteroidales bacterium]|nr:30S ribosomal protein S2 [Bacteroidales bacterium]MDD4209919.1 30S ribosomal protein S2 [Bacteroidales bacterium]MDY0014958.1 30S ribosomal protein S2 [Bacteroidales bacterium]